MGRENELYYNKGSHFLRSKYSKQARNLRGVSEEVVSMLAVNIPYASVIRRSMQRNPRTGKKC